MKYKIWSSVVVMTLFAALAMPAEARIVYTPVNVNLPANGSYPIDLNGDGIPDFTFQISRTFHFCSTNSFAYRNTLNVQPTPAGGIVGGNWASALQSGVQIDSHQSFYGGDDLMYDVQQSVGGPCRPPHMYGYWVFVQQRYLGLEFQINGAIHYGWAELSTDGRYGNSVNFLYGFAYETIPFKGILTGQTMDSPDEPGIGPDSVEPGDSGPTASVAPPATQPQSPGNGVPVNLASEEQQQQSQQLPRYTVTDLGTLGGTFSAAEGLNNRGWVEGISNLAGDQSQRAFVWRNGAMTDLGTLGGPNSNAYYSPNERGEITGNAETLTLDPLGEDTCGYGDHLICLPFVWQTGVMTALPTTLGGSNGYAHGVNNRGQIVGSAENATHDPTCTPPQVLDFEPVKWGPKHGKVEITQLPLLPGDTVGDALWINDNGQAVGITGSCTTNVHAALWQDGAVTDLGNLGGTINNIPFAINNEGQVVGQSDLPGDTNFHAFLWQNGVMTDLGTLPGDTSSVAFGINGKGQMVGTSYDASANPRAFLLQRGVITDLNTLIPPGSPLFLLDGNGINSSAEIVGDALQVSTGEVHAYLATPCNGDRNDKNDFEDGVEGTTAEVSATSERPKIALPENVRNLLRQQLTRRYLIPGQPATPRD